MTIVGVRTVNSFTKYLDIVKKGGQEIVTAADACGMMHDVSALIRLYTG